MYYIEKGLKCKWLAVVFAVFAMAACLGTGNATQSNSISLALNTSDKLSIAPWITGLVLTAIVAVVILGGVKRIASVNEKMVPFMALFFVICAVASLILNMKSIPGAFALIFKEAFNFKAAAGGVAGYGIMKAINSGFSRGVFSNEAGLGSAPIAHAASTTKDPVKQGLWGMFEVFFTTIIICTVSALVILTTGLYGGSMDGAELSINSFNAIIPGIGGFIVTVSTVFFALSTILGWAYYGEVSVSYIFKKSKHCVTVYRVIYVLFVFIGAVLDLGVVWDISLIMNTLMAVPNLIGLIGLSGVVVKLTKDHFAKKKNGELE